MLICTPYNKPFIHPVLIAVWDRIGESCMHSNNFYFIQDLQIVLGNFDATRKLSLLNDHTGLGLMQSYIISDLLAGYIVSIQNESCKIADGFLQGDWQHVPSVGLGVILKWNDYNYMSWLNRGQFLCSTNLIYVIGHCRVDIAAKGKECLAILDVSGKRHWCKGKIRLLRPLFSLQIERFHKFETSTCCPTDSQVRSIK